jgi:hypothetical protein
MQIITYDQVKEKIIEIRNQKVILDSDVAALYDVETKRINEAVKNNPRKFPYGYILELNTAEWDEVRSKISTSPLGGGRAYKPKAFTERGLYMLATILKSPNAIETTIAIIETFAQLKELTQAVRQFAQANNDAQRIQIFEHGLNTIADLLDNNLTNSQYETGFKIKLPFFEISRKIIKAKK